jgi:hypothetical protein
MPQRRDMIERRHDGIVYRYQYCTDAAGRVLLIQSEVANNSGNKKLEFSSLGVIALAEFLGPNPNWDDFFVMTLVGRAVCVIQRQKNSASPTRHVFANLASIERFEGGVFSVALMTSFAPPTTLWPCNSSPLYR